MTHAGAWTIYAPIIVAFGVVVLTTFGNTILEWYRQGLTRRHAAETLRRVLIEELRQAKETADLNSKRSDDSDEGGSLLIPVGSYPFYEANILQLGLLTPTQVSAVVHAYGMLRAETETLAVLGTFHQKGPILQAVVDGTWGKILAQNKQDLSLALEAAIDALEGRRTLTAKTSAAATA